MSTTQGFLDELTNYGLKYGDVESVCNSVTSADKVRTCLANKTVKSRIVTWIQEFLDNPHNRKDDVKSEEFRNKGNRNFSEKEPSNALSYYNLAVQYATHLSLEECLAFTNRSASFFFMNEYEKCIADVDHALFDKRSPERCIKLLVRKAKCLLKLEKYSEAIEAVTLAEEFMKSVTDSSIIKNVKQLKSKIVEKGLNKEKNKENKDTSSYNKNGAACAPEVSYGSNPVFPYASDAIELREDPVKGRHVMAKQNIKQGDTLFVEKPFAFVILRMGNGHCHYCCKKINNPLPCWGCSAVEYCNEDCRLGGWENFHKWECGGGLELCQSLGIAHLGLRLALVAQAAHNDPESGYDRVQSLLSHVDKLNPTDLYQYTVTAAILVTYLEIGTKFFEDTQEGYSEDRVWALGGAILEHIGQLICNGHAITKLQDSGEMVNGVYSQANIRVATAIYPSASMMNHSCDHNIMHSFYNQYLVAKASRDIGIGEEVFNCYGPHYRQMGLEQRQKVLLEQYKFKCTCKACTDPLLANFDKKFSAFLCPYCGGPAIYHSGTDPDVYYTCLDCEKAFQIPTSTYMKMIMSDQHFKTAEDLVELMDYSGAIDSYLKSLHYRKIVFYKFHENIRDCLDKLAKCYASLSEYWKSFDCVEQNLISVEQQFGECSSEVVYELTKICNICLNLVQSIRSSETGSMVRKTLRYIEKTKLMTDILFGKWSQEYEDVCALEENVNNLICGNMVHNV